VLTFLQDMDAETGPTRIMRGSHTHTEQWSLPTQAVRTRGLPAEELVTCAAGDVLLVHCDCTHAGSANTSGGHRYFITSFITQSAEIRRRDWPRVCGGRDDLQSTEIEALLQRELTAATGPAAGQAARRRLLLQLFGRGEEKGDGRRRTAPRL
jgi:ectoine hydroxylase-related dioxygenase (phytanoyl-CoA dioxygenase family)